MRVENIECQIIDKLIRVFHFRGGPGLNYSLDSGILLDKACQSVEEPAIPIISKYPYIYKINNIKYLQSKN